MADRSLTYRIIVDASSAKGQARNVRAVFEAELRSIKVGQLDTSGLKSATAQAKLLTAEMDRATKAGDLGQMDTSGLQRANSEAARLRLELEQAGRAANNIKPPTIGSSNAFGGISSGSLAGGLLGGFAAGAAIGQLRELGDEMVQLARRGAVLTQLADVLDSYTKSVGSNSQAFITAGQKASQGTIAQYDLILNANRAIQFEVAKTSEQYAKLIELSTALGRAQGISDTQALEFLTTGLARESRLILDNLGLIISTEDATASYAATIGKTADQLTAAERKTALLNEAFRQGAVAIEANRNATESTATAIERYDASITDLKDSFGRLTAEILNVPINRLAEFTALTADYFADGAGFSVDARLKQIDNIKDSIAELEKLRFQPTLFGQQEAPGISEEIDAEREKIALLHAEILKMYEDMGGAPMSDITLEDFTTRVNTAASEMRVAAEKLAEEQEASINKSLLGRAEKSVEALGADRALELYRKAKADAEAAIQALVDAGVTDAAEFGLRVESIMQSLTAVFDEEEERAKEAFSIDFSQLGASLTSLDASFVDFLPGVAGVREELANLSAEMMYSGSVTEEQAAQFAYLSSVAYTVADAGSQLNQIVGDLGTEFLESNAYAAELVNQMFLAEAAFHNGQISSGQYAGIMSILSGRLLTVAEAAGIATGAIYAFNSAQSDMSNLPGFSAGQGTGGSIADRIQTQQAAAGREQNRREMERYNRDMARAGEQSAKRAGKALEDGAKKASQELKAALDKVPGLFGTTQVTEQDMIDTKLGVYQEKADEYLRRLRDEVKNGKDWADVSIEEARAGLARAGLEVGATDEATLALLERSINDSSLFSAIENIPIFINEEAVKYAQELQKKSEEGRKNVYEYFGVIIEDASAAATGGGGGGASIEVKPPNLVDIDPLTEGLQTGLEEYVKKTVNLLATTKGKMGAAGTMLNPEITITADASAQALTPFLSAAGQGKAKEKGTPMAMALTPTIDAVSMQTEIDKLTPSVAVQLALTIEEITLFRETVTTLVKPSITPHLSFGATEASEFTVYLQDTIPQPGITPSLAVTVEEITLFKEMVSTLVKPTVAVGLTLDTAEGGDDTTAIIPLLTSISSSIAANIPAFSAQGMVVAQIIMAGIIAHLKGSSGGASAGGEQAATPLADAMLGALSSQFSATQNMFYAVGFLPAGSVESGFKGYAYTGLATSFMEKLTTEIRTIGTDLQQRGGTMAGYVQAGFVTSFSSEAFKAQLMAIGELMYSYLEIGILSKVNGGALTNAIAEKVVADIATEIEQP